MGPSSMTNPNVLEMSIWLWVWECCRGSVYVVWVADQKITSLQFGHVMGVDHLLVHI
jgi:hypothetical protein